MDKLILAIDQGTSSSRAVLFNMEGEPLEAAQLEVSSSYPNIGWVEQNPIEILNSVKFVVKSVLEKSKVESRRISAIGITNQRESIVVWSRKTGEPVYPAIIWQDRRTSQFCEELKSKKASNIISGKTGLIIDPYFSASKIRWVFDNVKDVQKMAEDGDIAVGTIDSWLLWNLTSSKIHATDYTNASRTMLLNIKTLDWDDDLLKLFSIPRQALPKLFPSSSFFDVATAELNSIPIHSVVGDQQGALFGQTCLEKGMAKNTYGTGCFLLMNIGSDFKASSYNLITTLAAETSTRSTYALEGSVFVAGAIVKWFRDQLGIISSSAEVEGLARSVSNSAGVYLVPALTGLGAPYWDAEARGVITGVTFEATKAHIVRAGLESMAYQTADVLKAMEFDSGINLKELRVDGGASVNNFLLQFQADILDIPVLRSSVSESTALGAAYLAGLSSGIWKDLEAVKKLWKKGEVFEPKIQASCRDNLISGWKSAVEKTLLKK